MKTGNGYQVTRTDFQGLITTYHPEYGEQVWSMSKLTIKHKNDECAICRRSVGDHAYRPFTNGHNRMKRICASCGQPETVNTR